RDPASRALASRHLRAISLLLCLTLFFFFQAEDGIRAPLVTGVQTCALPISCCEATRSRSSIGRGSLATGGASSRRRKCEPSSRRSEERRVGKECRARWWPYDENKSGEL